MADAAAFFANKKKKKKAFKFNANKIDAATVTSTVHVYVPFMAPKITYMLCLLRVNNLCNCLCTSHDHAFVSYISELFTATPQPYRQTPTGRPGLLQFQ
jgi:hypothetical protein